MLARLGRRFPKHLGPADLSRAEQSFARTRGVGGLLRPVRRPAAHPGRAARRRAARAVPRFLVANAAGGMVWACGTLRDLQPGPGRPSTSSRASPGPAWSWPCSPGWAAPGGCAAAPAGLESTTPPPPTRPSRSGPAPTAEPRGRPPGEPTREPAVPTTIGPTPVGSARSVIWVRTSSRGWRSSRRGCPR